MTSNDAREECLECHMRSNYVRGECYIIVMTGRCVNKPVQTEAVGCYENIFISNLRNCVNKAIILYIFFVCFTASEEEQN